MFIARAGIVATGIALLTACSTADTASGGGDAPAAGTAQAYCSVMNKYKTRYLNQFATANTELSKTDSATGPMTGALYAVMAITDLGPMWRDMAKVAPTDIKSDTERLAGAWGKETNNSVDNPLAPQQAIAKNLAVSLTVMGPAMRVNSYVSQHC